MNDEPLTTDELKDLSLMWMILSGDARYLHDDPKTAQEFWGYSTEYHNLSLSASSFFDQDW